MPLAACRRVSDTSVATWTQPLDCKHCRIRRPAGGHRYWRRTRQPL